MKKVFKKELGITLVALVITIIILLILAGITISQLSGSGLFENAKLAEQKSKEAQEKENGILADYENKIGQYINGSRDYNAVTLLWTNSDTSADIPANTKIDLNLEGYNFVIIVNKTTTNVQYGMKGSTIMPVLDNTPQYEFTMSATGSSNYRGCYALKDGIYLTNTEYVYSIIPEYILGIKGKLGNLLDYLE